MRDSYEPPDHRPWQARRTDWAAQGPRQDHPGPSGQPAASLADWAAQDPYQNQSGGQTAHEGSLDYRPASWVGHDPFRRHPTVPRQPTCPAHTEPFWRQGWADYDPYTGYPSWPGHPAYAARNAGLRRLSKLTWRAAEVSAIVAVGLVAVFARTAHSATKHVSAQHSVKPSAAAAHPAPSATHPAPKQHKPRHHHHHHASPPALAPPAAAPAPPPPAPPAPAPPPPPATTSGGSGGG